MRKKWHNILPWTALTSGILMVILLAWAILFKSSGYIESATNRKIAYDKLKQIHVDSRESINSRSFTDYLENTLKCPEISTKWLISDNGVIIYENGMMSQSTPLNSNVYSLIDNQSRGLLDAVDENLDSFQKEILYIAAAIRREGEHNDILGHIVMPLKTSSGELAGFVGVAYELDSAVHPVHVYIISIALILCFLVYWLSLPVWVWFDARDRNEKYILWTLFVLIGNLPAFIAYLLTRKQ
ncbi:MAG: hypothetical protein Q8868_06210 [Bacteroidota bacterium]|nr:hypothetical protein [Bacteroidota bacterium]